jgi:hypothetical protein
MSAMTNFYQNCPVCGRSLRIAVKYFGRPMSCSHCRGEFVAGRDELAAQSLLPFEAPLPLAADVVNQPANCGTPQAGEV